MSPRARMMRTAMLFAALMVPHAVAAQQASAESDWSRLRRLEPGTEVLVTAQGSDPMKVKILFVDNAMLVTLKPVDPKLPGAVETMLIGLGDKWPSILQGQSIDDSRSRRRVSRRDGIFDGQRKLADFAQVVQESPRELISEVRGRVVRPHSPLRAALMAGGGFFLGAGIAAVFAQKYCGRSCDDEKFMMGLSLVGFPAGFGFLGYYTGYRHADGVLYRASQPVPAGLDEATWQRLRNVLPASLRGGRGR